MTEPPFEKSHWSILPGLAEQLLHYLRYANQTPFTINIPNEHTRQRRRTPLQVFPATEGWFFESERLANRSQQADENQEKRD
jgi:hypothetical protein